MVSSSSSSSADAGDYDALHSVTPPDNTSTRGMRLLTGENVTLLGAVLVLSLAYIAQQSIRQRSSEKRAFEKKRRLLGISSTSTPSHTATAAAAAQSKDGPLSIAAQYASALSRQLHIDTCVKYVQDISPPSIKRLFDSQKTRRRKDKAMTSSKCGDGETTTIPSSSISSKNSNTSATSAKETRGRAGTITSSDPRSSPSSKHVMLNGHPNHHNKTPNSPQQSPAGRPSASSRSNSSKNVSNGGSSGSGAAASSSRSRSATHSAKQQQQQRASSLAQASSLHNQIAKPILKDVGIQVSPQELDGTVSRFDYRESPLMPLKRKANHKKSNASSASMSPNLSMESANSTVDQKTDFDIACSTPLPSAEDELDSLDEPFPHHALSRNGTITNRSLRDHSQLSSSRYAAQPESFKSATSTSKTHTAPSRRDTKESVQSPTCSSSGRSASLSVSTDATGLTSLRDDQEVQSTQEPVKQEVEKFQPSVSLRSSEVPKESEGVKQKTRPNILPYSFHTGFQEPTTLEEGEIDESSADADAGASSPHQSRQEGSLLEPPHNIVPSNEDVYLPSPPDSQRKIRTDALGYPSIPLPPSNSSPSSSTHNSPSSARRAVSSTRTPFSPASSSSNMPQSPAAANERRPSNANLLLQQQQQNQNQQQKLESGMYPSSLGVQSPSSSSMSPSYGLMPTSPPSHHNLQQQLYHSPSTHAAFSHPATFAGMHLASPQLQPGTSMHQQQQQIQQYIAQTQYQYQHLMQHQQQQATSNFNPTGQMHVHTGQTHPHAHSQVPSALQSPAHMPRPSPGFLDPMHTHLYAHGQSPAVGGNSSSGGSNRSSVHHASQLSSRSTSPQPSMTPFSSSGTSTAPTEADVQSMSASQSHFVQHQQEKESHQQQQQHGDTSTPQQQSQQPNHNPMDLVQKMMLMQAQIQFAMQQNEAQSQQAQAQAHAQAQQQYFQSMTSPTTAPSSAMPPTPLSANMGGHALPSPLLYAMDGQQQGHSTFTLNGITSPMIGGMYPYQAVAGQSSSVTSPYQQHLPHYQVQQQHQLHNPGRSASTSYSGDGTPSFPTVRRRQSTPALGGDATMTPLGASQASTNGSPYMTGKKRNRRYSRPYRMSSYGQVLDSPDYLTSPVHDTSAQYDAEVDMSTTSSSYNSTSRPNYDRRRSSLIPPPSPLLNTRKERRYRHKEKERERARQLEMEDDEVTRDEDDIKADLELLARMQESEDKNLKASQDDIRRRMKSMETVLERRGKELEIARWKLKCVEVDRRSIEAEVSLLSSGPGPSPLLMKHCRLFSIKKLLRISTRGQSVLKLA